MFAVINKYGKGAAALIATMFGPVYHVACGRLLWNWIFQTFIQSPFLESVISEIHRPLGWSFFANCSKFNVDFRNVEKNWEKVFCFWDNSIWIDCIMLSLLRREHSPSVVNVLRNSLKILHSTKTNFFYIELCSQWSINMVIVPSSWLQQCLCPFTMLLVEVSSETGFFRIYLITFLGVRNFTNISAIKVIFFSKMFKM